MPGPAIRKLTCGKRVLFVQSIEYINFLTQNDWTTYRFLSRRTRGGRHARSIADQLCLVGNDYLPIYQSVAVDRIHFLGRS
jgi:hypothetical protein